MGRTRDQDVVICLPLDDSEQDIVAELMRLTGFDSAADVQRLAFWHLCRHYDVPIGEAFHVQRRGSGRPRSKKLASRQLSERERSSLSR